MKTCVTVYIHLYFFAAFGDHLGQLFLISLQASNDFGLGKQTGPRYIRAGTVKPFSVKSSKVHHYTFRQCGAQFHHKFPSIYRKKHAYPEEF